ncbi:MAG: heavy-metal-associated domain-containing protein [Oligoflexia bacterium]|nr:heavy-metal-associated domain-containing protein [Oligoflexia bacterium]
MFRSLVLGAALFVGTPALACPMPGASTYPVDAARVDAADGSKIAISVEGMKCGACANKVVTALKGLDGVIDAAVDYQTGQAHVAFDSTKVDGPKMVATITKIGYPAKLDTAG